MRRDKQLILFDWAIKMLLKCKANFDVLEGFLSELLSDEIKIQQILDASDKGNDTHNRVDVLVENSKQELILIEIQNSREYDYFHRMLYGTSKAIAEHIGAGKPYAQVKKVISITIAYFDLGQGEDYLYNGSTSFKGIHLGDVLSLTKTQKELHKKNKVYEIYPEYWLIKVHKFNDQKIMDKLDEWIYFLKNGQVQSNFTAKGLKVASNKLNERYLSDEEHKEYYYYLKRLRDKASEHHTKMADLNFLPKEERTKAVEAEIIIAEAETRVSVARAKVFHAEAEADEVETTAILALFDNKIPIPTIAYSLCVAEEDVRNIINEQNDKNK